MREVTSFYTAYCRGNIATGSKVFVIWRDDKHISERTNLREGILIGMEHYGKLVKILIGDRMAKIPYKDIYLYEEDYYLSGLSKEGKFALEKELEEYMEDYLTGEPAKERYNGNQ